MGGHTEKAAVYKLERESSPEYDRARTPILGFQPLELWENQFLLLKTPVCGLLLWPPKLTIEILSRYKSIYIQIISLKALIQRPLEI